MVMSQKARVKLLYDKGGIIYTPELNSCLDGITRKTIMTLAAEEGYEVREKRITRDEVYVADEAFFTGTAAEVTPIRELDNREIGSGSRGPITRFYKRNTLMWYMVVLRNTWIG